jgi:putative ABC transport system permease protein
MRSRRREPSPGGGVARRRMHVRDLAAEALAGISARPARLALTTSGSVLGIGALVATIGLAQTASGQVAERFDAIEATQVQVAPRTQQGPDGDGADRPVARLPWDAPERVLRLNGAVAAGTFTQLDVGQARARSVPVIDPEGGSEHTLPVVASSAGLLDAVRGEVVTGRFFDRAHDERGDRVAVLGVNAAERLHLNRVDAQPAVFLGEEVFTVVGVIDHVRRRTELLDAVIVPNGAARQIYDLAAPGELHVRTQLGAAAQVGRQSSIALDPNRPESFRARVPPSPGELRERVKADVNALFLALGGVALLVGALGIANVTLLSVLERIGEIGLRRALGATRGQVAAQFLVESSTIGLLGGLVGTAGAVLVTVGVAVVRDWTPLLEPALAAGGPLLGGVVGLVAGTYPAWKASAIEPITALRGAS